LIVSTYLQCLDAWGGIKWPDGGPLLDQPVKLTRAFAIIRATFASFEKKR
jgi:hypothetical protein